MGGWTPRRMNDRPTINTPIGEFDRVEWIGRNSSGIQPFGDRVLILPDQATIRSAGGILKPPEEIERKSEGAETGVLVAIGDGAWAWNSDRSRRYEGEKPIPGQRVYFERYAGGKFHGKDGLLYRLMDDKAVGGLDVAQEGEPVVLGGAAVYAEEARKLQEALIAFSDAAYGESSPVLDGAIKVDASTMIPGGFIGKQD